MLQGLSSHPSGVFRGLLCVIRFDEAACTVVYMLRGTDGFAQSVDRAALLNDCSFVLPLTDRTAQSVDDGIKRICADSRQRCAITRLICATLSAAHQCWIKYSKCHPSTVVRSVNGDANERSFNSATRPINGASPSITRSLLTVCIK